LLETPLVGRFYGEGRRLTFGAPAPYQFFVRATAAVGIVMVLMPGIPVPKPLYDAWWTGIGLMVIVAAVAAFFSLQAITFDLRERTYRRRQGPGFLPRFSRGRLDDLDAIVVLTETNTLSLPPSVTYHVVLHWKGMREPLMVLQKDTRLYHAGEPINAHAAAILQLAARYAQALGVRFFDNTYYPSPCPVPIWK
jgi:hypothetical protein